MYLHRLTEPWFCGYCKGDHEPGDFFRRIGHGGKRLPGAFSPSPDPPVENDERYPETIDLEQDPLNCSSPSDPSQRKRKAERSGSEQPRKRPKIKVTVDNELPGSSATSGLPQAKRKLANPEVGTPHKKHKITADKGGFKMPQHEASEPQTPSSSANSKGSPWSTEEEDATIKIMQDVVDEQQIYGDKRWTECAKRLKKQYAVNRSAAAIKNQWNRVLRARSGVDERKHPNPSRMTTGSLTPKKRKRAQLAFPTSSVAAEDEEEGEEEEEEEEEEEVDIPEEDDLDNEPYAPPRKRSLRGGTEY